MHNAIHHAVHPMPKSKDKLRNTGSADDEGESTRQAYTNTGRSNTSAGQRNSLVGALANEKYVSIRTVYRLLW